MSAIQARAPGSVVTVENADKSIDAEWSRPVAVKDPRRWLLTFEEKLTPLLRSKGGRGPLPEGTWLAVGSRWSKRDFVESTRQGRPGRYYVFAGAVDIPANYQRVRDRDRHSKRMRDQWANNFVTARQYLTKMIKEGFTLNGLFLRLHWNPENRQPMRQGVKSHRKKNHES